MNYGHRTQLHVLGLHRTRKSIYSLLGLTLTNLDVYVSFIMFDTNHATIPILQRTNTNS